jgi:hypothetical protein
MHDSISIRVLLFRIKKTNNEVHDMKTVSPKDKKIHNTLKVFLLCPNCALTADSLKYDQNYWGCCGNTTNKKLTAHSWPHTTTMHCGKQWFEIKYPHTQIRSAALLAPLRGKYTHIHKSGLLLHTLALGSLASQLLYWRYTTITRHSKYYLSALTCHPHDLQTHWLSNYLG